MCQAALPLFILKPASLIQQNNPEELNRIMSDHASTFCLHQPMLLLRTSCAKVQTGKLPLTQLTIEDLSTGDIMYDNALFFAELAEKKKASFLEGFQLKG